MPKKVRINPNQRVDLVDFTRSSHGYTDESFSFHINKLIKPLKPVVVSGFRVEVPDQTVSPGEFTVYNGVAIDRNGQVLNNEQQVNDSRTTTLSGTDTDFYIEVEFAEGSADVDSRAFWDGTYTGNDPKGREFSANVATRLAPDWKIVSPISTSGFEVDSDPTSNKVPIAVLHTNVSEQIINVTKVKARTILAEDYTAGATQLKVIDSSLFPDSGTIDIDSSLSSESGLSFSSNDRDNNILTLSGGGITSNKSAGDIIENAGAATATFVQETLEASPSTGVDRRSRLFSGEEERGHVFSQDDSSLDSRTDKNIKNLKDYIDFVASQVRELKFGNTKAGVVQTAPPSDFSSTRYFDAAGSVTGARTSTVTVGDASNSYGDFNTPSVASAIELAHNNLDPTRGGSIYVKQGLYTWNKNITFNRPVTLIFDAGVEFTAGTYAGNIDFTGGHKYKIVGMPSMSAYHQFTVTIDDATETDLTLEESTVSNIYIAPTSSGVRLKCKDSKIATHSVGAVHAVSCANTDPADIEFIEFNDCTISYNSVSNNASAYLVKNNLSKMSFNNCTFDAAENTGSCGGYVDSVVISGVCENLSFTKCKFVESNTAQLNSCILFDLADVDRVTIEGCLFDFTWNPSIPSPPKVISVAGDSDFRNIRIDKCDFSALRETGFPGTSSTLSLQARMIDISATSPGTVVGLSTNNIISNNIFGNSTYSDPVGFCTGIWIGDGSGARSISIVDNRFSQLDTSISVGAITDCSIVGNYISFATSTSYISNINGIRAAGDVGQVTMSGNAIFISSVGDATVSCRGIYIDDTRNRSFTITGNEISISGGTRSVSYGIYHLVDTVTDGSFIENTISGNNIEVNSSNSDNIGIYSYVTANKNMKSVISSNNIGITGSTDSSSVLLYGIRAHNVGLDIVGEHQDSLCVISDNVINIKPQVIAGTVDIRGIRADGLGVSITGNVIKGWYAKDMLGIDGVFDSNAMISNNNVSLSWDSSQSGAASDASYGIRSIFGGSRNLSINNNNISGGSSMTFGILASIASPLPGTTNKNISINGNNVHTASEVVALPDGNGCIRIENTGTEFVQSVSVCNNTLSEDSTDTSSMGVRRGIDIAGTSSGVFTSVVVNNNSILGAGPSSDRSTDAMRLLYCFSFTIIGNVIDGWATTTNSATLIATYSSNEGAIIGNVLDAIDGTTYKAIAVSGGTLGIVSANTCLGATGSVYATGGFQANTANNIVI